MYDTFEESSSYAVQLQLSLSEFENAYRPTSSYVIQANILILVLRDTYMLQASSKPAKMV